MNRNYLLYALAGSTAGMLVWIGFVQGGVVGHTRDAISVGATRFLEPKGIQALVAVGSNPAPAQSYLANVSAYCPCSDCCGIYADGITASGHVIQAGDKFVAAPKHIPFGTMITIPDYGRVPVLDRGGAIKDNKLDLYFADHESALKWGRRYLQVTIERRP